MRAFSPLSRVCIWALPLIGVACLLIIVAYPRPQGLSEHIALGYIFGTMFGQTTLAAAWAVFGPFPLSWRLPLSVVWVTALPLAMAANFILWEGELEEVTVMVGVCLLGQWLLLQLPLWGLARGYRLGMRTGEEASTVSDPRDRQFGIRQLMIFTAIVGVIFGIGRVVVLNLAPAFKLWMDQRVLTFAFFAVAAIAITLPLVLVVLLPPRVQALFGTSFVLFLIALATAWELPLLNAFARGPGVDAQHLIWINVFTSFWIVVFGAALRLSGYRLGTPAAANGPPPSTGQVC